jgi:hypothetical protein
MSTCEHVHYTDYAMHSAFQGFTQRYSSSRLIEHSTISTCYPNLHAAVYTLTMYCMRCKTQVAAVLMVCVGSSAVHAQGHSVRQ